MKKFSLLVIAILMVVSASTLLSARDEFGLLKKGYVYIQSALDSTRSRNGFWDIPGNGGKTRRNGAIVQVWTFENQSDRMYRFYPRGGENEYAIRVRNGKYVNASGGRNGAKLFLDSRPYTFKLKYMGGGRWKIFAQDGRAITLPGRSSKRGNDLHLWSDHNGPWMEWRFIYTQNGRRHLVIPSRSSSSRPSNNSGGSGRLDAALANTGGNYFRTVSYRNYLSDNRGNKILNYLNSVSKKSDQWKKIVDIANDVVKNRNSAVKLNVLRDLSRVSIKKASGFLEKVAVKAYQKRLSQIAGRERNRTAKTYLERIKNKF